MANGARCKGLPIFAFVFLEPPVIGVANRRQLTRCFHSCKVYSTLGIAKLAGGHLLVCAGLEPQLLECIGMLCHVPIVPMSSRGSGTFSGSTSRLQSM